MWAPVRVCVCACLEGMAINEHYFCFMAATFTFRPLMYDFMAHPVHAECLIEARNSSLIQYTV